MKRKVLLISNPGENGAPNFCEGVNHDVENYSSFLTSPVGGLWERSEIKHLHRPSEYQLLQSLISLKDEDYSMIIFSGHGYYDPDRDSTVLELRKGEEIDSIELRSNAGKRTIILDCCREIIIRRAIFEEIEKMAGKASVIHPEHCRLYYNESIEKCANEIIVMNACGINELAGDDSQRGGVYSYSLIRGTNQWARINYIDTSSEYSILSVVEAHDIARDGVTRLRGSRQNPQIEKPRSGQYFPFCIVA